jgi:formylmethanofuran dehydrogenase subunit D
LGEYFILITGRTVKQAAGLHKGKDSDAYRRATELVEMNAADMARLGIGEGQVVRLRSATGKVDIPAHVGTVPSKIVFVPMGPVANSLIGPETEGTGMPSFKGLTVEIELI